MRSVPAEVFFNLSLSLIEAPIEALIEELLIGVFLT